MSGQEHQPGKQTGAAERVRRYRARRREGVRIASAVEVKRDVLYALAMAGWIDHIEAADFQTIIAEGAGTGQYARNGLSFSKACMGSQGIRSHA